jgi:hypothetical protein
VACGKVAEHGIDRPLFVQSTRSGVELFDEIADSQNLACYFELLLYYVDGVNGGLWVIGTPKIPAVEARKVLQGT